MHSRIASALVALFVISGAGCAALVSNAASGMAKSLTSAMLNQDDPGIVRDGAPAYLLLLDSMVQDAPENVELLRAAAELYSAYGVVFVEDGERARSLTRRARSYGQRALCTSNTDECGLLELPYDAFEVELAKTGPSDVGALYSLSVSWLAYIRAHREEWTALAQLPQVRAALERVQYLDGDFKPAKTDHYLGVLNTLRPPALGGDFESGRKHFERAIAESRGIDLGIKLDYAKFYARTLYDRELHDRLLNEVLETDPNHDGLVLMNVLAQREARELLESADEYF